MISLFYLTELIPSTAFKASHVGNPTGDQSIIDFITRGNLEFNNPSFWYQIDMSSVYFVSKLLVLHRNGYFDRFKGITFRVGSANVDEDEANLAENAMCFEVTEATSCFCAEQLLDCMTGPLPGRFVTMENSGPNNDPNYPHMINVLKIFVYTSIAKTSQESKADFTTCNNAQGMYHFYALSRESVLTSGGIFSQRWD